MHTVSRIIAIDPANRCGWATSDGRSGVWDLTPAKARAAKPGRPAKVAKRDGRILSPAVAAIPAVDAEHDDQRLVHLWAHLDELARDGCSCGTDPDCCITLVHEGPLPHHASQRAAQLAFWWQAALILWAHRAGPGVRRVEVTPLDLQRFVLGRRATTGANEMLDAARDRLGYTGGDDNEADALWFLEWARKHVGIPPAFDTALARLDRGAGT